MIALFYIIVSLITLAFLLLFIMHNKNKSKNIPVDPDKKDQNSKENNYINLNLNIGKNGKICFSDNICLEEKHLLVLRGEAPISIAGYTGDGKGYSRHLAVGRDGAKNSDVVRSSNESDCDDDYHHAFRLISPVINPQKVNTGNKNCTYPDHPNTGSYPQSNAVNLYQWAAISGGKWP